jgi:hypothetical protein
LEPLVLDAGYSNSPVGEYHNFTYRWIDVAECTGYDLSPSPSWEAPLDELGRWETPMSITKRRYCPPGLWQAKRVGKGYGLIAYAAYVYQGGAPFPPVSVAARTYTNTWESPDITVEGWNPLGGSGGGGGIGGGGL